MYFDCCIAIYNYVLIHRIPSGGYDHDFVDTIAPKYHCNICMKVLQDPRLTECCGQHYCDSCLKKWLKRNKTCPQCRKKDFQNILDKAMIREIKEFKVRCTNKMKGCKWVDELGTLKHHLESDNGCDYVMVTCSNIATLPTLWCGFSTFLGSCGEVMERRHLIHHQKNECLYRQHRCQYCGYIDTYDAITGSGRIRNRDSKIGYGGNHYSQCYEYPLKCPNECGAENIKRKNMETHRENCPMEPLDCPFQHVGCSAGKILRKDMDSHCKDNMQPHLLLVLQSNQALAQKNEELSRKNEEIAHKNEELCHKHGELVHKNEELCHKHGELVHKNEELCHKHGELVHKNEELCHKHGELVHKNEEFEERIHVLENLYY